MTEKTAVDNIPAPDPKWGNWTPSDGPVPGVFLKRPPGHRCIWTCRWSTAAGMILAYRWPGRGPDEIENDAFYYELQDYKALGQAWADKVLAELPDLRTLPYKVCLRADIAPQLHIARARLKEYIWPRGIPPYEAPYPRGTNPRAPDFIRPGW